MVRTNKVFLHKINMNLSKRLIVIAFVALFGVPLLSCAPSSPSPNSPNSLSTGISAVDTPVSASTQVSLSKTELKTRQAAVKIVTSRGHGSGAYMLVEGYHVVFTAAHVVKGGKRFLVIDHAGNKRVGTLVYTQENVDFAILLIPEFKGIAPMKLSLPDFKPSKSMGKELLFSGFPAGQSLRTVRSSISGIEGKRFVLHSTAWGGSSGSCVFDSKGNFAGIVFAITLSSFNNAPVLLESMVWVEPYSAIDWVSVKKFIRSLN